MTTIIIAESHAMMRKTIRALLEKVNGIEIVGEVDNGQDALVLAEHCPADVLITDMMIAGMNGLEISRQVAKLRLPTRVMILSMYTDTTLEKLAFEAGACAYLSKHSLTKELVPAVQSVSRGEIYYNAIFLSARENGKRPGLPLV